MAAALLLGIVGLVALLWWAGLIVVTGPKPVSETRAIPAAAVSAGELVVPVAGLPREGLRDSWGDPRDDGARAHHGLDIAAPPNTPVLAAAAGTVEKMWQSAAGGTTAYVRSPDRRWIYYYAHLAGYAPGLAEGRRVAAGETIGFVGDTGNAGAGNYHLHFGMARARPEERWHQGTDVNPYPLLAARPAAR